MATVAMKVSPRGHSSSANSESAGALAVGLVFGLGLLTFASVGIHVGWAALVGVAFLIAARTALLCNRGSPSHRLLVATVLGFAAAWVSPWVHTTAPAGTRVWEWAEARGFSAQPYDTRALVGFPLRFEGHGGGGADEFLPVEKGLWAFVANFPILVAAAAGLLWAFASDRRDRPPRPRTPALTARRARLRDRSESDTAMNELAVLALAAGALLPGLAVVTCWLD